jgi:tetratricopeptide (TPR) repeat protein
LDEYYDIGTHTMKVTTASAEAQTWFDRGLAWAYGFNFEEALRCFRRAAQADPDCAMAWWGIAYAGGPVYNRGWGKFDKIELPRILKETHEAAQRAMALRGRATDLEQKLVEAIARRHPSDQVPPDFSVWTEAYADAMRAAHHAHSDSPDVCSLCAEALMTRTPWRLWDLNTGLPREGASTLEARKILEDAIAAVERQGPTRHAGLLHCYIHVMEMSPIPEAALRAGDELCGIIPDSGHLHHMSTHIDFQCGDYHNVILRNSRAIEADMKFLAEHGPLNLYSYSRIHNIHFKLYGAMFLAQSGAAMEAVREFEETVPEALIRMESPPMADMLEGYYGLKYHALIRFGRWQEIIDEPLPSDPDLYLVTTAIAHYAKTVAHAASGDVPGAEREKPLFYAAKARVPESRMLFNNTCVDILGVASAMLEGELEYRRGNHDVAFDHLRTAIEREDTLPYDEPWGWMQPARHALGALSLEQGRIEEAEAVYRADLGFDPGVIRARRHPDNVWSLHGLHECLKRQGKEAERAMIEQNLTLAIARADVPIKASCFCRLSHAA